MKKLKITTKGITTVIVMMMILFGSSTVFAQHQHPGSDGDEDTTHMQQELKHDPDLEYDDEVPAGDVNPAVSAAIVESYPGYGIAKVYSAKDGSYKVKLEKENHKITAYYSVNGELLKEVNDEDKIEDK